MEIDGVLVDTIRCNVSSALILLGPVAPVDQQQGDEAEDASPAAGKANIKRYTLAEMKFFMMLRSGFSHLSLFRVCEMARAHFPQTYNKAFNTDRASVFPKLIRKKEAAIRKKKEANAEKKKKRLLVKDKCVASTLEEKEQLLQGVFKQQPCAAD